MAKEVGYWTVSVQTDSCNAKNQAHRLSQLVPALHPVPQKVVSPVCTPLNNGEMAGYLIQLSAQVVEVPLKEVNRVFCIHTSLRKQLLVTTTIFAPSRARRPSYGIVPRGPTNIFSCLHYFWLPWVRSLSGYYRRVPVLELRVSPVLRLPLLGVCPQAVPARAAMS